MVPDTWHLMKVNDFVPHLMKGGRHMNLRYKRHGERVILSYEGDLVLQPTHLETSLLHRVRRRSTCAERSICAGLARCSFCCAS